MKVTTERQPNSLIVIDVELDSTQVEKGLDRAARRLSQKHTIPGFRKGKAPRFIIENYFGRAALMEEAQEDLINKSYKKALEQEQIAPVGQAALESVEPEPFRFRVSVPVAPTVTIPEYREIRVPLEIEPVTDEMVERTLNSRLDKHVALQELDEPRPAQEGDQLTVKIETVLDGESLEQREEGDELPETPLVLEEDRLVKELFAGLVGAEVGQQLTIPAQLPDDHANEEVRGRDVVFQVEVVAVQERVVPPLDELPQLEEVEGTLDDLRAQVREELTESVQQAAEQEVLDTFTQQLIEQTEYDMPAVMTEEMAESMLEEQNREFQRYGITLEQMLQYRGQTMEEARESLLPVAEQRVKTMLALQEVIGAEQLNVSQDEMQIEVEGILGSMSDEDRMNAAQALSQQETMARFMNSVASSVIDRKLRVRMLAIAAGEAPDLSELADEDEQSPDAEHEQRPDAEHEQRNDDDPPPAPEADAPETSSTRPDA